MDLNAKTEPKSPSAHYGHADVHADARGIAYAIFIELRKDGLMNNCAKLF